MKNLPLENPVLPAKGFRGGLGHPMGPWQREGILRVRHITKLGCSERMQAKGRLEGHIWGPAPVGGKRAK